MGRDNTQKASDTYSTERPDPLELIARFLVPGSYRVPVEGRSSRSGLRTSDVAAAVGYMREPLGRQAAVGVATRAPDAEIARW